MRGEGQVMVGPLSEDGHQVGVEGIALHLGVCSSEDTVGDLPHLQHSNSIIWLEIYDLHPRLSSFPSAHIIHSISRRFLPGEGFDR